MYRFSLLKNPLVDDVYSGRTTFSVDENNSFNGVTAVISSAKVSVYNTYIIAGMSKTSATAITVTKNESIFSLQFCMTIKKMFLSL